MKNFISSRIINHLIIVIFCSLFIFTFANASENKSDDIKTEKSVQKNDDGSDADDDSDDSDDDGKNDSCGNKIENNDDGDDKEDDGGKSSNSDDDKNNDDNSESDDDESGDEEDCGNKFKKPFGTAHFIIDNTAGSSNLALVTNLSTSTACSKNDVLSSQKCNSFALGNNNIQVIQNNANDKLTKMIGINNDTTSSYENAGTNNQLNYFTPDDDHYIDMTQIRAAADEIALLDSTLPTGTYGSISFKQFIENIAQGRNMYGIVRVKVPLVKANGNDDNINPDNRNDDSEEDDGSSDDGDDSSDSKSDDGDDKNDDGGNNRQKFELCKSEPTAECSICGPSTNTKIQAGETICGITLGEDAKVNVFGSLMFDWIDCENKEIISLDDLRASGKNISFDISVPLNINPANPNNAETIMKNMSPISNLVGDANCPSGKSCNIPLNAPIPYDLLSKDFKETIESADFNKLTQASKFHLLMPSGYSAGWKTAFDKLNITAEMWQSWKLESPTSKSILTLAEIESEDFQDIPALMYNGGLVGIHHHTNISGLVYIPQSFDLEQNGIVTNGNLFTPSLQYISGAIIVRDGFYFEARFKGGATIISNDPGSYSQTRLNPNSPGKKPVFLPPTPPDDNGNNPLNPDPNEKPLKDPIGDNPNPGTDKKASVASGTQWMEIRPQ